MFKGTRRCTSCSIVQPKETFPPMRGTSGRISRVCSVCQAQECHQRFWEKVDKASSPHGCWLWTAYKTPQGYGEFSYNGIAVLAHRLSWEWEHGPIPEGMHLCHDCPGGDNPACIKNEHHFLGTPAENINDAINKGISVAHRNGYAQGEDHHLTTHTKEQVRAIRTLVGKMSQRDIAKATHTNEAYVSLIIHRKIWAHLP